MILGRIKIVYHKVLKLPAYFICPYPLCFSHGFYYILKQIPTQPPRHAPLRPAWDDSRSSFDVDRHKISFAADHDWNAHYCVALYERPYNRGLWFGSSSTRELD